jgi:hypothetical protein
MVGLGGLPFAHDDVEDFEGGPGTDGVQWIGRRGVRGWCIVLVFLLASPLVCPDYPGFSVALWRRNGDNKAWLQQDETAII